MIIRKVLELKFIFSILSISDALFIIYLSLNKFDFVRRPYISGNSFSFEAIGHIIFYLSLSTIFFLAFKIDWNFKFPKFYSTSISLVLGISLEIIQGTLIPYRSFEGVDLLANLIGITIFFIFSKRFSFFVNK